MAFALKLTPLLLLGWNTVVGCTEIKVIHVDITPMKYISISWPVATKRTLLLLPLWRIVVDCIYREQK